MPQGFLASELEQVTSADIVDSTIVNADIAAAALIQVSKLEAMAAGTLIYGDGTGGPSILAAGTSGQVLRSGGAGAPAWSTATYPATAGTSGTWLRSDGTNIVNSTATLPATAAGTGTILRADGTNWIASTATYPTTAAVSTLLYASATDVISALATANGGLLNTSATGVPSITATPLLGVAGTSTGTVRLSGATSGVVTITPNAVAGTWTLELPAAAGTANYALITNGSGVASWSILPVAGGGTGVTTSTGTTSVVLSTSPALTTPTVTTSEVLTRTALGGTTNIGHQATNTTAAAAGAQQVSPAYRWTGQGWKTDATAASQSVEFQAYVLPVQGAANPTGTLVIERSINGGAYGNPFSYTSTNILGVGTSAPAFNITGSASGVVVATSLATLSVQTSGQEMSITTDGAGAYHDVGGASTGTNNNFIWRNISTNSSYSVTQKMTLNASGNLGLGTSTFGTNAVTVFSVANGTAPTTGPADTVQFYSSDSSAANTIPSFYCEGTGVLATGQADSASATRVRMRINGTEVVLLGI